MLNSHVSEFKMYCHLSLYQLNITHLCPDVNAILPRFDPVHRKVVAKGGSSVNLVCRGSNVAKFDTSIWWTFNGRKIKSSTNKVATMNWLSGDRGRSSLHIRNVSEDVVGEYQCNAAVNYFGSAHTAKAVINLQLYERGSFDLQIDTQIADKSVIHLIGHFRIYHNSRFGSSKILHKHCFQFHLAVNTN